MEQMEIVDREWLRENVETKASKPCCVYVGSQMDPQREYLEEDLRSICAEVGMELVWHDAFSEGRSFAMKYQVQVVPTMLFFRRGQVECQAVGFIPRSALLEIVQKAARTSTEQIIESIAQGDNEFSIVRTSDGTVIRTDSE